MKKGSIFLKASFLVLSVFFIHSSFGEEVEKLENSDISNKINNYKEQILKTDENEFGAKLSTFNSPKDLLKKVKELNKYIKKLDDSVEEKNSSKVQDIYVSAFKILYKGRGETSKKARDGWFLANQRGGKNGQSEIEKLLEMNLFDESGKERLKEFVENYDFEDTSNIVKAGFPPGFSEHYSKDADALKTKIKSAIDYAPSRKTSYKKPDTSSLPEEIISGLDEIGLERNYFAQDGKMYYGREEEMKRVLVALTSADKSHVILSGKAGVGKTTMMSQLQQGFLNGLYHIDDTGRVPMIVELSITDITNQTDPTIIKQKINKIKRLSKKNKRHVIVFIDEAHTMSNITKNSLKAFLGETKSEFDKVHMICATTSREGRLFQDPAFERRFTEVFVRELTVEESKELIENVYLERWKEFHGVSKIEKDVYDLAGLFGKLEQSHAGNPVPIKELIENAISYKRQEENLVTKKESIELTHLDLIKYIKFKFDVELIPTDPDFEEVFEKKWAEFEKNYIGQEGFKHELKSRVRLFFSTLGQPDMMEAWALLGPPGVGKSYFLEAFSKTFFKGESPFLTINGGEYKDGSLSLNKLTGSPTGVIGSEQQRSILTKFLKENPLGGIIAIEEADYMHKDILDFFVNMISEKKFTDGLGEEYDVSRYILVLNSNQGQNFLIPEDINVKMDWEGYERKKSRLVELKEVNEKVIEFAREDKKRSALNLLLNQVVRNSQVGIGGEDSGEVAQSTSKLLRRVKPFYLFIPSKEELIDGTKYELGKLQKRLKILYRIELSYDDEFSKDLLDIESFDFRKGFSNVTERMEILKENLLAFYSRRDSRINLNIEKKSGEVVVKVNDEEVHRYFKKEGLKKGENEWANDLIMREKIKSLSKTMKETLFESDNEIDSTVALLKSKLLNWNERLVVSLLGTTGNGKTEFAKVLARSLYDDEKSLFIMDGLNHPYDLSNYLRPPTGVMGSNNETEFERWFKERKTVGGGVILIDELLSFSGLNPQAVTHRVEVINKLYPLLDEGMLEVGGNKYDARGFIVVLTGNSFKELLDVGFSADSSFFKKIVSRISNKDIIEYFKKFSIGPEKIERFGKIFIRPPLSIEAMKKVNEKNIK